MDRVGALAGNTFVTGRTPDHPVPQRNDWSQLELAHRILGNVERESRRTHRHSVRTINRYVAPAPLPGPPTEIDNIVTFVGSSWELASFQGTSKDSSGKFLALMGRCGDFGAHRFRRIDGVHCVPPLKGSGSYSPLFGVLALSTLSFGRNCK